MNAERANLCWDAKDLDSQGRQWIERALGRPLRDGERIFVTAMTAPDEATRRQARERITQFWAQVDAYVEAKGYTPEQIEGAIDEAMEHVRHRKPA